MAKITVLFICGAMWILIGCSSAPVSERDDVEAAGADGDPLPSSFIDPWTGDTGEIGEDFDFSFDDSTRVDWVREITVSTMAGAQEALAEKAFLPFEVLKIDSEGRLVGDGEAGSPFYHLDGCGSTWEQLLGTGQQVPRDTTPYLVRAVYFDPSTGGFSVWFQDGKLLVHHACLGRNWVPMKKSALIVALPSSPTGVRVSCRMAE